MLDNSSLELLQTFPPDTVWCETITSHVSSSSEQHEEIEVPDGESMRSIRIKLKMQNRLMKKEQRLLKKIERILQDQSSKLDLEDLMLKGLTTALPRQKWQEYLTDS